MLTFLFFRLGAQTLDHYPMRLGFLYIYYLFFYLNVL